MSWKLFKMNFWDNIVYLIENPMFNELTLTRKEFNTINYIYNPYPYMRFVAERLANKRFRKLKRFRLKTITEDSYVFTMEFEKMNILEMVKTLFTLK